MHWRFSGYLLSDPIAQLPTYAVTSEDILGWMERRRTVPSRATGKIVTEATIRRQLEMISRFFSWAVEQRLIKDNPCRGVKKPAESDARERIASDDEIRRLKIAAGSEGHDPHEDAARLRGLCPRLPHRHALGQDDAHRALMDQGKRA